MCALMLNKKKINPPESYYEAPKTAQPDMSNFWDMAHEMLIVTNDLGQIVQTNKTFQEVSGYDEEALRSLHFMDLFGVEDKPYIRNTIQAFDSADMGAEQPVLDFEARILTKDGDVRQMEWRQRLVGGLLYCCGRDVTDMKAQDGALTRRDKQLSEAQSLGRMGHWNWDMGQEVMEWSDEIYRMFGAQKGTFEPTLEAMNAMVHRDDIAVVNKAFQRALIEENDYDMEFRIKLPDNELRYVRCKGRCGRDDTGEVVALYGIMQDMTERMLHQQDLENARDSAERAYNAKTQFLANMSHELRTPLNAIIGFSEMMEQQLLGPIGTEKYLDYIGGIRESGTHLLDLISDILDMSKIEAGKYELDLEEMNVMKSVKLSIHMMEGRAHESGVKVKFDGEANEALKIIADRRAVLQILLNLLSNAVKFSLEGGEVMVSCAEREDYIVLKVSDTGIGIPANKLAGITRPFEQVSSSYSRDHEGSGLGLAITKELAQLHGGMLSIESRVGEGTSVSVRMPCDASKFMAQA
jgi:two-component system cell cycle sensor histidine kinase PleC